jgi:DNA-binding IclR family transcriptional regulator
MKTNRSVERAMAVLMYVCQGDSPVGLTDISRGAGLDKATTLRLLTTLANIDLVRQRE